MGRAAGLRNYLKGDASTASAPGTDESWSSRNPGPYIGIVKGNIDPTRMGRLKVHIPSLAKSTAPEWNQLVTCEYLSPFYGAKGARYTDKNSKTYEGSQHAYGFWGVPPDLETSVLVIFAEGEMNKAFWIGCIQDPYTNHMVPGIASSEKTYDKTSGLDTNNPNEMKNATSPDKMSTYGTTDVPSGELNRAAPGALVNGDYEAIPKPIHPFAEVLLKQGLAKDKIRGTTTSSARRESPSQVFGISTPGRKDTSATPQSVSTPDAGNVDQVVRGTGHTFVMDDGDEVGDNQLTRLRTASGHQLLMHDTDGVVYIANGSGNAWIEMNSEGRIDVYSGVGGINLRTEGDFNLHSDANINMNANGAIRMSASNDKGEGAIIQSADTMITLGDKGIFATSQQGPISSYAAKTITSYAGASQLHGAGGMVHLAGTQVHLNSAQASPSWGPSSITKDQVGMEPREEGDVELTKKGVEPLESFTRKTKTTVHRFITHEPMPRFKAFSSDGKMPPMLGDTGGSLVEEGLTGGGGGSSFNDIRIGGAQAGGSGGLAGLGQSLHGGATNLSKGSLANVGKSLHGVSTLPTSVKSVASKASNLAGADDRKTWQRLANTPGTPEFIAQRNRTSPIEAIKIGQFQSDAQTYLKTKMGDSTNPEKARRLLQNYGVHYDETFGVSSAVDSISTKMQGFSLSDSADAIKNNVNTLSNQVLESVSGKATQMFKDNVFVNQSGQLFSIGQSLHGNLGDLSNIKGNVKSLATNKLSALAGGSLQGMIPAGSIGSVLSNVGQVTNVFKNVMGGQITGVTQMTSLAQKFGIGTGAANIGKSLHGVGSPLQGAFMSKLTSLTSSVGSAFRGAVGKFFSDARLKTNIQLVGKSPLGTNIYSFKYKQLDGTYQGVMAQEVLWASELADNGYYIVDYSKLDVEFRRLN